jgi:riboflavin synthase
MFTGLVEEVGSIGRRADLGAVRRLRVNAQMSGELSIGESVAVSGVCLTVVGRRRGWFDVDVSPETLEVTTLGALSEGALVNLERAMRLDDRVGGHLVQGHVDGVGVVERVRAQSGGARIAISYPRALGLQLIPRGSIAVDGVSLTIARLEARRFDVQIIPHTLRVTRFRAIGQGDRVNLECDMIGKYAVRAAQAAARRRRG